MLQAQQIAVSKYDRPPFYNLNIDAGAMWARRIIDRLIAAEETPPAGEQTSTPSVFARQA